jgi:hypothetical protein
VNLSEEAPDLVTSSALHLNNSIPEEYRAQEGSLTSSRVRSDCNRLKRVTLDSWIAGGDGSSGRGEEGSDGRGDADGEQESRQPLFTKDDITTFAIALGCSFFIRSCVDCAPLTTTEAFMHHAWADGHMKQLWNPVYAKVQMTADEAGMLM